MTGTPEIQESRQDSNIGSVQEKRAETSLYDFTVPVFLQTVTAVRGFLERTVAHCEQSGANPDDFVNARLFPDMAPLHFQIECIANHSVYAMHAMRTGCFDSPDLVGAIPFAGLQARVAEAEAALKALGPDEVNTSSSRPSPSSSRFRCTTSFSTPLLPTISCACEVCRLARLILRANCVL
jgi:hypothetical protein